MEFDQDKDEFNAAFADLKEEVEGLAAGRARLSVKQYCGTGGIRVVCQEAFHHNFDLTHEHWAEIIEPCIEQEDDREIFVRKRSRLAFAHVLLTGDKAAGKTTFLNGLTTGDLRILQCLRYESALFYNIWYAPTASDLADLRQSLTRRALPFFQTELAHGAMMMDAPELAFFLEDEEFAEDQSLSPMTAEILHGAQHVMIKVLELGGDCLHELLQLQVGHAVDSREHVPVQHPVKVTLLQQTAATVRMAARVAYFVNLQSLFTMGCQPGPAHSTADECGPAILVERLKFLHRLLRHDTEVIFFCTKPIDVESTALFACICHGLSLAVADQECLHEQCRPVNGAGANASHQVQLHIVRWLATYAGIEARKIQVFPVEHLCEDASIDHTAVLQSLRRLLGGSPLGTADSALPLLAEQVVHLLLDNRVACVNKDLLADLLEPFEDSGHAELYRNVLHPMVVVPSMVLLDSFDSIMQDLEARGLAHPADREGQIHLEATVLSDTTLHLQAHHNDRERARKTHKLGAQDETVCWRFLVQEEAVAEARNALNLFQPEGFPPQVPQAAAVKILMQSWKAAQTVYSASSLGCACSELFLAARFLLLNGFEELPEWWALNWVAEGSHSVSDDLGDVFRNRGILLQMPQATFTSWISSQDSPKTLELGAINPPRPESRRNPQGGSDPFFGEALGASWAQLFDRCWTL